jgi:hypothetical protein
LEVEVGRVTSSGADSSGALALLLCFFLVVKTLKMSCENSGSCSLLGLVASLTCRMCDLMTSSIQLVEALCRAMCGGGSCMKTMVAWAGGGVAVVCKVSHVSILALRLHLMPSKGTGWPFGR